MLYTKAKYNRYKKSDHLTFDKLKQIIHSAEHNKSTQKNNPKDQQVDEYLSADIKEEEFIRKNSTFQDKSRIIVPKKTGKHENLKACLFKS